VSKGWESCSTREWRRIRKRVLDRDGHRCQLKLEGCTTLATHVHHLAGKAAGDEESKLVAACPHCNLQVGDPAKHDPDPKPWAGW
jgi:5-methylcytosine-specific restriction endonuclease McrA